MPIGAAGSACAPQTLSVAPPSRVLAADASGVQVQTGAGVLVLTELQRAGGKRLAAAPFLAGHALAVGTVLGGAGGAG